MEIKTLYVLIMVAHYATAHICLLSPRQRGALDISTVSILTSTAFFFWLHTCCLIPSDSTLALLFINLFS